MKNPLPFVTASVVLAVGSSVEAAFPLFPGPTFDVGATRRYSSPGLGIPGGATASDGGAALCDALTYENGVERGRRTLRWDFSGAAPVELGTLGTNSVGVCQTMAFAINAVGTATGYSEKYLNNIKVGGRAVRWAANSNAATELGTLGDDGNGTTYSEGYAINAAGTVVGYAEKYVGGTDLGSRAVRWNAFGTAASELGTLGTAASGSGNAVASAVNSAGTTVGYATKYSGGVDLGRRAVRWDAGSTVATELGTLGTIANGSPDNTLGGAFAVNNSGTAVGCLIKYSGGVSVGLRAVRWDAGTTVATELGTLGGNGLTYAFDVNDSGTAVGIAPKRAPITGIDLGSRAVRWDAGQTAATELGNLGTAANGSTLTYASAISATGITVGFAQKYAGTTFVGQKAVLWDVDGVAIDLNTLLSAADAAHWSLYDARFISDANYVSGLGEYDPDGAAGPQPSYSRAFLMPVPEPTGLAMIFIGGAAVLKRRQR